MIPAAVLFDCDGVLVDSEPAAQGLILNRLAEAGLTITPAQLSDMFLGGTMAGVAAEAQRRGAAIPEGWVADTYALMFEVLARGIDPIPGAPALVARLIEAGLGLAVCSNGPVRKMEITLGGTGMWEAFEGRIFSGHVHGRPKPEPDIYLAAAVALGHPPERCVVIEDSPTGARAARAAGMRCLGLARDSDADRLAAEGAQVILSLDEVPGLLGLQ